MAFPASPCHIEPATERDLPLILTFIRELAEYERLTDEVSATESDLRTYLFGPERIAHAEIAYVDHEPAGFAV
jgi:hypothetical protein